MADLHVDRLASCYVTECATKAPSLETLIHCFLRDYAGGGPYGESGGAAEHILAWLRPTGH
jgi:hypothetical protein